MNKPYSSLLSFILITITSTITLFAQETPVLKICVSNFENHTGPSGQRIVPGIYLDTQKKTGSQQTIETQATEGKNKQTKRNEDIYQKDATRLTEYSPGQWSLPSTASSVAADELTSQLTQEPTFFVLRPSINDINPQDLLSYCQTNQAAYLITGNITHYRIDRRTAQAYGITRTTIISTITLDLRVIETATGRISYQYSPTLSFTNSIPSNTTDFSQVYDWQTILRNAIRNASINLLIDLNRINTSSATYTITDNSQITLDISSSPQGADIFINDIFHGNTPAQVNTTLGQKKLTLKLQGYETWENQINPTSNFKAAPQLKKITPGTAPKLPKEERKEYSLELK